MDTLECMRIFVNVATVGGFTSAAKRLDIGVPAVSRAIAQLETSLNSRLLNRTTRRVALTEAGERYLCRCRDILSSFDDAQAEARSATAQPKGRLRVHALSSFGHQLLIPAVLQYQQRFPELRVEAAVTGASGKLLEDGYDVSIVIAPALPNSCLVSVRLGTIAGVVCGSPAYLAKYGEPDTPQDLSAHHCLQLTAPAFSFEIWERKDTGERLSVNARAAHLTVNAMEALEPAASKGLGIAILPAGMALSGLRSRALVRVLADYSVQPVNVYAVYQSRRFLDAKIRAFVDLLKEEVPAILEADEHALSVLEGWSEAARAPIAARAA